MNDGLDPIKQVYGEEPTGTAPAPGTPKHVEFEALRTMKQALDELPHPVPSEAVVDAVKDAAAADILTPLLRAYGEEIAQACLGVDEDRVAECELLQTTRAALDTLPRVRPDAAVLDAVISAAAAHHLAPLLAAYDGDDAPTANSPVYAEFALLSTTKAALETLPRVQPDAAVLAIIKSAAAERLVAPLLAAYAEWEAPSPDSPQYVEFALLSTTKAALDQLPRARPDASVVAAVRAAAKPGAPALKVASGRPARSASNIRRWTPALAWAASLVVVAGVGLWVAQVFPGQNAVDTASVGDARSSAADEALALVTPTEPQAEREEAPSAALFSLPAGSGQPTVSQNRLQDHRAAIIPQPSNPDRAERRVPSQVQSDGSMVSPPQVSQAGPPDAVAGFAEADTNMPAAAVSAWDAGEDFRVLSLRLNQLASSSEGLSWDEPPTPLGAAEPMARPAAEGLRIIRAGGIPARVDVQMRSSEPKSDR